MDASKKIVFISHISEEKDVAIELKRIIDNAFLGAVDVFVSSDQDSIGVGQKWLNNVSESLKNCIYTIVICSPASIERPWINFETGASWIRDIDIAPLCHSGLSPATLPPPLNLLQGDFLSSDTILSKLLGSISKKIGLRCPEISDVENFKSFVHSFEERYTFLDCALSIIRKFNKETINALLNNKLIELKLPQNEVDSFVESMDFLQHHKILSYNMVKRKTIINGQEFCEFNVFPTEKLAELVKLL